jgi:hypothetical protein
MCIIAMLAVLWRYRQFDQSQMARHRMEITVIV